MRASSEKQALPIQGLRLIKKLLCATALLGLSASMAQAVPSYARQTGAECAACHVGGFGPQLTPYGIKFKINGYTDSDGGSDKVPLSAMLTGTATHTDAPGDNGKRNNSVLQEASVFVAGRLSENIGTFIQATYSGVDKISSLDQVDIRYVRNLLFGGKEATVGLSLNTNPTLTDPFNTLGQWRFPYISSDFNAGLDGPRSPLIENLGGSVVGLNAYGFFDNSLYAEVGLYNTLSKSAAEAVNADYAGKFKGVGTYWRLAYFKDMKKDNFSVGLFGMNARQQTPDVAASGDYDRYNDVGIDASYQFLGNRQHIFSVNTSYVREWSKLNATAPASASSTLNQFRLATSYHYNQTWGATAGIFDTRGSSNAMYDNGRPNTSGYMLQADWTPWGKEGSWASPWANVRVGLQYTGYQRFNGTSDHAGDNNTTTLFVWTSI